MKCRVIFTLSSLSLSRSELDAKQEKQDSLLNIEDDEVIDELIGSGDDDQNVYSMEGGVGGEGTHNEDDDDLILELEEFCK